MAVLHTAQGIAVLMLSRSFSLPISTSFLHFDKATQSLVPATATAFNLSLPFLVAGFFLLSAIFHLVIGTLYRPTYEANLAKGMNKARWYEYSISASVMMVAISLLVGRWSLTNKII